MLALMFLLQRTFVYCSMQGRKSKEVSYVLEEFLSDNTGPGINRQFHLADLLVDLLHEVDDKVHQLVFVHLLRVEVGNQEANIISL